MKKQSGFSLFEVMVALTLFSVFIATFMMSQGYNLTDSMTMREETTMLQLCQSILNQTLINPPEFTNSLDGNKNEKSFPAPYEKYKYKVEFKKLKIPDLSSFLGMQNDQQDEQMTEMDQNDSMQSAIFQVLQRNIEEMLWQVRVTVTNKENDMTFSLATWMKDYTRGVDTSGI